MSKVLDKAFLESVFPPERTEAFFDALFGGAEEGAYDIVLVCRSEGEGKAELAFELHQRPGKCLACNLTYGLPQVFQRHIGVKAGKAEGQSAQGQGEQEHQHDELLGVMAAVFPVALAVEPAQNGGARHRKADARVVNDIECLHPVGYGAAG